MPELNCQLATVTKTNRSRREHMKGKKRAKELINGISYFSIM
jgi:hypothetical protein